MNRKPFTSTSITRRFLTVMACAAVLLASFEDEVLLATTLSAASERGEAGALPPDSEGNAAFPDLSRSDTDERFQCSVARTVPTAWLSPHHSGCHGAAIENAPAGQPVCFGVLYCVWRI